MIYKQIAAALLSLSVGASAALSADVASPNTVIAASYRLGPGDKLRITVFNEPNLTGDYTVTADGNVSMPLVGDVAASGLSLTALQGALTERFNPYVKNPRVSVEQYNYRPYYILGEVNKPGEYAYSMGLRAEQAIAMAGGYTYRANRGAVSVRHPDSVRETRYRLHEQIVPIAPGDVIRVGERFF